MLRHLLIIITFLNVFIINVSAGETDAEGYPVLYLRGSVDGTNWQPAGHLKLSRSGNEYSISLPELNGEFKIADNDWSVDFGAQGSQKYAITASERINLQPHGPNFVANGLHNVLIKVSYASPSKAEMSIVVDGGNLPPVTYGSGTLPVMYINVKTPDGAYNNEIIDRNLAHKDYFNATYWLDTNGCEWLEALGAKSVGSADEPLPLQIKARGNWTRIAFSKKPFKIKLDKKQALLGLTKSKHFALLAHADDYYGYMRNFSAFELGRRIGLPWSPAQQPVELVINGDYRGLYFLTESIRVGDDRVEIAELADSESNPDLISGGYIVELDNYDADNQIQMPEQSFVSSHPGTLRVTFEAPEVYSDLQRRFITDQFTAINSYVGTCDDAVWTYLDLDDAARYFLVNEIVGHAESYHGSTYLFRDRGEGQKWHFSPLWDMGNAFRVDTHTHLYDGSMFGCTWIGSLARNARFAEKVKATWRWFMAHEYGDFMDVLAEYASHISEAAKADAERWKNAPVPANGGYAVYDNSDMGARYKAVSDYLCERLQWLESQYGSYGASDAEPARDVTPAAPLPEYASSAASAVQDQSCDQAVYYNLHGIRVAQPRQGEVYIRSNGRSHDKILFR